MTPPKEMSSYMKCTDNPLEQVMLSQIFRLAEWFCRVVCRWLRIQCDHFFDDYWIVSRQQHGHIAQQSLLEVAMLLGIAFDPDKTQPPSPKADVLGVVFDLSDITSGKFRNQGKSLQTRKPDILCR